MSENVFPHIMRLPVGPNILVLSPHPGDEVIGCGGTIYQHSEMKDKITVLQVTDGRSGRNRITEPDIAAEIRIREAREALKILGVENVINWQYNEDNFTEAEGLSEKIVEFLNEHQYDIIYMPPMWDEHPVHRMVSEAVSDACETSEFPGEIFMYELMTPIIPNAHLNITDVFEKKKEALNCLTSQNNLFNLIDCTTHLNIFRASRFGSKRYKYVEAYWHCVTPQLQKLHNCFANKYFFI